LKEKKNKKEHDEPVASDWPKQVQSEAISEYDIGPKPIDVKSSAAPKNSAGK